MQDFVPRPTPKPSDAQREFNAGLGRVQAKLLHALDLVADKYVERYSAPAADGPSPADVRRRTAANALQIWRKCPRRTCRRSRACRGEAAHCLDACIPALPPGMLAAYIAGTRRRPRR